VTTAGPGFDLDGSQDLPLDLRLELLDPRRPFLAVRR
jgi:hypothetical protein